MEERNVLYKISVVIPIYNSEQYLRKCINSVLAQSYNNLEVVLVNDGSTDNCKEICMEYEKKYPNIIVIHKENGGLSDARNSGIKNATGDYILFLDSDDYWESDFLGNIVKLIQSNKKVDYIFFRYKYYFQKSDYFVEPMFPLNRDDMQNKSGIECLDYILKNMKDFQWFAWAGMVRRDFILENNLFFLKGRTYEDVIWTPEVFLKSEFVDYFDYPVTIYRLERDNQITSTVSYSVLQDNIYIVTSWYEKINNSKLEESLKEKLMSNIVGRYIYCIKFAGFLNSKERQKIILTLKNLHYLFKYENDLFPKIIFFSCKIFGFTFTTLLLKVLINLNRKFKIKSLKAQKV